MVVWVLVVGSVVIAFEVQVVCAPICIPTATNDAPVINLKGFTDRAVHLASIEDVPVSLIFELHDVDADASAMELNITAGNGVRGWVSVWCVCVCVW